MINAEKVVQAFENNGVDFFTGVPDSFLNGFCKFLTDNVSGDNHVITANEGNAIALAAGRYLANGNISLVYMQNSGIGNALNPLISLVDKSVYDIPMILLIGWRGEPGIGDHAQHELQGKITTDIFDLLNIPYIVMSVNEHEAIEEVQEAVNRSKESSQPVAVIVRKGILSGEKQNKIDNVYPMIREDAIKSILLKLPSDTIYVATTGRATRELFVLKDELGMEHDTDVLNVGAMGHASSIAAGIALANKNNRVVCLDGDSSAIMHLGAMATIGKMKLPNLLHVILNNGVHESVGGQPSGGYDIDFTCIAKSTGYNTLEREIRNENELSAALDRFILTRESEKSFFMDVRVSMGMREGLGPLNTSLGSCKKAFMEKMASKMERGIL